MRHLITPVIMLAIGVAGLGFYRGWFTLATAPAGAQKKSFTVVVDPNQWKHDRDAFLRQATPVISELEKKLGDLVARSQHSDSAAQPAITQEIQDLTKQHQELKNAVNNLSNGSQDHWEANGSQISQKLDNLKTGFQRTFARVPSGN